MFECNYLTMLMKPTYEKPVDTAQDILDRGLNVIYGPGTESIVEILKNSHSSIIRQLAERTIVPKVIFCNISILILNFPQRIGMNMIRWLKMQLLPVLLLLNVLIWPIMS